MLSVKKSAQYSWSSFITLVLYLENSREEEHGKNNDLTEEEEGVEGCLSSLAALLLSNRPKHVSAFFVDRPYNTRLKQA